VKKESERGKECGFLEATCMSGTSDKHNRKNQQWLITVSTLTTSSDYRTPKFSPPKYDTQTASSGKQ
jgi:hypothetical protein